MSDCTCGDPTPHEGHCGCCGRPTPDGEWCLRCAQHLGPSHLSPWDRTYFGQHGKECPFDYDKPDPVTARRRG